MDIVINPASDKPLYQQIYEWIAAAIVRGELRSGEGLPPIRTVAAELRISVITVKKAWEELEHGGFIHTVAGKGCFVATLPASERGGKRDALVLEKLKKDLAYYETLGIGAEELITYIRRLDGEA